MASSHSGGKSANRSSDVPARGNCFTCKAFVHTEFEALPETDVAIINEVKVTRTYRAGEPIFRAGDSSDGIYCVGPGLVGRWFPASGPFVSLQHPISQSGVRSRVGGR